MGNNPSGTSGTPDLIDYRRARIAKLMVLRPNITRRAIQRALAQVDSETGLPVVVNPETGKAFSLGTIQKDVEAIKEEWQARSAADVGEFIATSQATLDELQGEAWRMGNLELVLKIEARRAQLHGLNKPAGANVGVEGAVTIKVVGGDDI